MNNSTDQINVQVLVVDNATDEWSEEFSEGAFATVVADDHLDDQGIAGDNVVQLMNLVCHLLFECGLETRKSSLLNLAYR